MGPCYGPLLDSGGVCSWASNLACGIQWVSKDPILRALCMDSTYPGL